MPYPKHEKHLCYMENVSYVKTNLADYKKLVRDAKVVCRQCGRTAPSGENICYPEGL